MSTSFGFSTVLTRTGATVAAAFFVLAAGAASAAGGEVRWSAASI
jgi:hypothetical protein